MNLRIQMRAIKIKLIHLKEQIEEIKCPRGSSLQQQQEMLQEIESIFKDLDTITEWDASNRMGNLKQALVALQELVEYQTAKGAGQDHANLMNQAVQDFVNK